jgi:SAM-dependent methyltransferase
MDSLEEISPSIKMAIESATNNLHQQRSWLDAITFSSGKLIDIGCGPGIHANYFSERGLHVTGLDRWSAGFQYHNKINFLEADSVDSIEDESFDYCFSSHVLEHCPNSFSTLSQWRRILKKEGALIIIVPVYSSYVANDHWITGWNIGQLAMSLVAAGFDCSQSQFIQIGQHVCGYGVKKDIPPTNFNIRSSLPFLPYGLTQTLLTSGGNELLLGDLAFADSQKTEPQQEAPVKLEVPSFSVASKYDLLLSTVWNDQFNPPGSTLDMDGGTLSIIVLVEQHACQLRLAVGSDAAQGLFSNAAEFWLDLVQGFNIFTLRKRDFRLLRGDVDWSSIDHWAFGGCAEAGTRVSFWLVSADQKFA